IGALLATPARIVTLIGAIEKQQIEAGALDAAARARLLETGDRARRLLAGQSTDRAKIVESHRDVVAMAGDVARGKNLFDENCARCHMPRKQGGRAGPDLSGINNKTREELLTSILDPSFSIEPRFTNYIITTRDGRIHDGVIASETPSALTLRGGSDEGDETILRVNIRETRASAISMMPDDLEKTVSKQGLADIIAYLRGGL
ncbi:MAG: c-type cytochrome, partial [Bryobacteraceae bacterium]